MFGAQDINNVFCTGQGLLTFSLGVPRYSQPHLPFSKGRLHGRESDIFLEFSLEFLGILSSLFKVNNNNNDNNDNNNNNNIINDNIINDNDNNIINDNDNNNDNNNNLYFKRVTQSNSTLIFPMAFSMYNITMVPQPLGHRVTKQLYILFI